MADRFLFHPVFCITFISLELAMSCSCWAAEKTFFPLWNTIEMWWSEFLFSFFERERKPTTETAISPLFSSRVRMAHWIGIFIRTLEKFLICAFVRERNFSFVSCHRKNSFRWCWLNFVMCFIDRDHSLWSQTHSCSHCIKLTIPMNNQEHIPPEQKREKFVKNVWSNNFVLCVVWYAIWNGMAWDGMEWYEKCKPHQLCVRVRTRCVTQRKRGNNVSLSVAGIQSLCITILYT